MQQGLYASSHTSSKEETYSQHTKQRGGINDKCGGAREGRLMPRLLSNPRNAGWRFVKRACELGIRSMSGGKELGPRKIRQKFVKFKGKL